MKDKIRRFYELGLYTEDQVAQFVVKRKLTPEDFEEITGREYYARGG